MSDPQQSWNPPGPQQPFPGAPQQWGAPPAQARTGAGGTPLLVLGLVTAALLAVGAVLPSVTYPDDDVSLGPLLQRIGGATTVQLAGLLLLVAAGLLVAGALLQRSRVRVGTGLLLVGSGMAAEVGVGQMLTRLQVLVDRVGLATSTAVGGILLMLAGATAVATVVVGLVRLSRAS